MDKGATPTLVRARARTKLRSAEGRHRALVRSAMGLLLVLSVVPATGQPAAVVAPFVSGCREILAQCLLVLRATGAPLHWIPIMLLGGGLLYATIDRVRLSARVGRLLRLHTVREPDPDELIGRIGVELNCLSILHVLVGPAPNPAFTAGILRPRIYIAEHIQETLTTAELRAVLRHELYHARHCDPLRFALLRFAAKALFWLPLAGTLGEDLMEDAEIIADDFAAQDSDPLDVASAIVEIGRTKPSTDTSTDTSTDVALVAGVAALGGFRSIDRRVRRLADDGANEGAIAFRPLKRRPMLLATAVLLMVWGSAALAPQPLDAAMTMRFGERCPHEMNKGQHRCPECNHKPVAMMPNCKH